MKSQRDEFRDWLVMQFSSVAQSCLTLRDPMDCSTPGFPVLHYLLEFAHTHVHLVGNAIQPSHPLLPRFLALNLSHSLGYHLFTNFSHSSLTSC